MLKFVARSLLSRLPILLGVILITILLVDLMPGDPAAIIAGADATPEAVESIRADMNLEKPLVERFFDRIGSLLSGDLGNTPGSGIPVWDRISAALPITLSLSLIALVMAVLMGVPAGMLAALRQGTLVDRAVTLAAAVLQAIPPFIAGLILVIVFALDRSWFPAIGYTPLTEDPWEWLHHLLLPGFTLALVPAAELARQTRGALLDTLEQDHIRAVRAKGMSELRVIGKHAAKNAATPVVTVLGLQVARVLGGAVVVELIFAIPGFGLLALGSVLARDVVLIQGVVLISAIAVLLANLAVDVSYGYLNPKTRA